MFPGEPNGLIPMRKGVVLLVDAGDHPPIEIPQDRNAVFSGADALDHLGRLRPAHDHVANHDFPVDIFLVHALHDGIKQRVLRMNI